MCLQLTGHSVELPALNDARGGFNIQTTMTSFSCEKFDRLRDESVVKGVYKCSPEENPGGLGTNTDSSGGNGSKNAAAGTFNNGLPTYSFCGFIALMFML